jgi:hypothetical protein
MHVVVMGVPRPLTQVSDLARRTQAAGISDLLFTETGRTAYLNAVTFNLSAMTTRILAGRARTRVVHRRRGGLSA